MSFCKLLSPQPMSYPLESGQTPQTNDIRQLLLLQDVIGTQRGNLQMSNHTSDESLGFVCSWIEWNLLQWLWWDVLGRKHHGFIRHCNGPLWWRIQKIHNWWSCLQVFCRLFVFWIWIHHRGKVDGHVDGAIPKRYFRKGAIMNHYLPGGVSTYMLRNRCSSCFKKLFCYTDVQLSETAKPHRPCDSGPQDFKRIICQTMCFV